MGSRCQAQDLKAGICSRDNHFTARTLKFNIKHILALALDLVICKLTLSWKLFCEAKKGLREGAAWHKGSICASHPAPPGLTLDIP